MLVKKKIANNIFKYIYFVTNWKFIDVNYIIKSLNKIIIAGIVVAIVIIGIGYFSGVMTGQTKSQHIADIVPQPQTSGRNITINLNEGLNLQASP